MVELSDSFEQLDTVGKLRYKAKLGMLGVTTYPYSTSRDVWPAHKVFSSYHKGCVNHDSSNTLYISIHPSDTTTRGFCLALPFRVLSLHKTAHSRSH